MKAVAKMYNSVVALRQMLREFLNMTDSLYDSAVELDDKLTSFLFGDDADDDDDDDDED